jgi:hypothetical protein
MHLRSQRNSSYSRSAAATLADRPADGGTAGVRRALPAVGGCWGACCACCGCCCVPPTAAGGSDTTGAGVTSPPCCSCAGWAADRRRAGPGVASAPGEAPLLATGSSGITDSRHASGAAPLAALPAAADPSTPSASCSPPSRPSSSSSSSSSATAAASASATAAAALAATVASASSSAISPRSTLPRTITSTLSNRSSSARRFWPTRCCRTELLQPRSDEGQAVAGLATAPARVVAGPHDLPALVGGGAAAAARCFRAVPAPALRLAERGGRPGWRKTLSVVWEERVW